MKDLILNYLAEGLLTILIGITSLGWWSLQRFFVTRKDCETCRQDIDARLDNFTYQQQETQIDYEIVQERLNNLPSKDDFAKLDKTLEVLRTDINGQKALFVRLEQQVNDMSKQLRTLNR